MTPKLSPKEIFDKAVEIETPEKQAAFLDEACAGDEKLRAEVEALLKWDNKAGSFMDFPDRDPNVTLDVPTPDMTGTVIGRYKLLEKIGEGGMATVYMAEQKHPIQRRVAFKIIKLGMDTKQVIARFEAERQALAMMDHPNIAKVFDAGSTDTGRPYFIMELVKGVAITEFCDSNHLTAQERLELFISVCQAVQHAHQRGVIHRDIKPSNVLVTLHDGKPVVKVIDFGIAKAVNQRLTEKTLFTRFSQMIGTPEYMSPEQAEMSGLDIDTRTDVFSLGVLLYELLTGATPFDSEYLLSKGYNEMQRIIREEEPVKPSTRVSTLGDSLSDIAKHRRTSPDLLSKLIRSDLDWIVMKTLEKDRQRRYESVSELAADVERHLNNEPVLAGRPSAAYRIQKFVRRNKVLVSAAVSVAMVVVLAAIISTVLAINAVEARRAETDHRRRAEQARSETKLLLVHRETDLYFNHIELAHQELLKNRPVHALALLEKCRKNSPNWEWNFLCGKSNFREPLDLKFSANVLSFDLSADGKTLAALCGDGRLAIRDLSTGEESFIRVRQDNEPFEDYKDALIEWVAFCPDGRHVAVAGDDYAIDLFSLSSGKPIQRMRGLTDSVTEIAFSPDGRLVVGAGYDFKVLLWGRESESPICSLDLGFLPRCLGFTRDGKRLLVGGGERVEGYLIADLRKGKMTPEFSRQFGYEVREFRASPDGEHMATALWDDTILITNYEYGEPIRLEGHLDGVLGVAFSPNGKRLASISDDMTIRLWDTETGRQILALEMSDPFLYDIAFSKDGHKLFALGLTNTIKVFDASPVAESRSDVLSCSEEHDEIVYCVNWSPYGDQLISSGHDGIPRIWNASDGSLIGRVPMGGQDSTNAQFSPDGNWITAWGIINGQWVAKVLQAKYPYREQFNVGFAMETLGLTFSADSRLLISGVDNNLLKAYDWQSDSEGEAGFVIGRQHCIQIVSIVASPEGKYLASTGYDGGVMIWDATRLAERQAGHEVYSNNVTHFRPSFSRDDTKLAVGGRDGEILILNVESFGFNEPLETLMSIPNAHGEKISCVSFDSSGNYLASCSSDKTVRVWDVRTGDLMDILLEHEKRVLSVAFSPDGRRVASAGADKKIRIWTPKLR